MKLPVKLGHLGEGLEHPERNVSDVTSTTSTASQVDRTQTEKSPCVRQLRPDISPPADKVVRTTPPKECRRNNRNVPPQLSRKKQWQCRQSLKRCNVAALTGLNRLAHFHYVEDAAGLRTGAILCLFMSNFSRRRRSRYRVKPSHCGDRVVARIDVQVHNHNSSRGGRRSFNGVDLPD